MSAFASASARSSAYRRDGSIILRKLARAGFTASVGSLMSPEDMAEETGLTVARIVHVLNGLAHSGAVILDGATINGRRYLVGAALSE